MYMQAQDLILRLLKRRQTVWNTVIIIMLKTVQTYVRTKRTFKLHHHQLKPSNIIINSPKLKERWCAWRKKGSLLHRVLNLSFLLSLVSYTVTKKLKSCKSLLLIIIIITFCLRKRKENVALVFKMRFEFKYYYYWLTVCWVSTKVYLFLVNSRWKCFERKVRATSTFLMT